MQRLWKTALGSACVVWVASCASTRTAPPVQVTAPAPSPTPVVSGVVEEAAVTATATVLKVDLKKRLVTLKGPDGQPFTITVGEAAKNLPQVKKGDLVTVTYFESIAYDVRRPGDAEPGVATASEISTAKPGQKPGGVVAEVLRVTATITAIDKKTPSVTLQVPGGVARTIKVRDPSKLEKVKVGDLVELTYSEALAVSVEKPKK